MSAIAEIYEALAALPERTPDQVRADRFSADTHRAAFGPVDDEAYEAAVADAADYLRESLAEIKLSKTARAAIEDVLDAWTAA